MKDLEAVDFAIVEYKGKFILEFYDEDGIVLSTLVIKTKEDARKILKAIRRVVLN